MEVHIKRRKNLNDGFLNLDEMIIEYPRLSDGQKIQVPRQVISKNDAVAVLLYDQVKRTFILVEQLRLPAHMNLLPDQKDGVLTEVIAGNIDDGEAPEQTAVRETMEETGFRIETVEKFGQIFSSPGYSTEQLYFYYAELTPAARAARGPMHLDESEDLRVVEWSVEEARKKIEKGEIPDMKTLLAFQWFFLKKNLK